MIQWCIIKLLIFIGITKKCWKDKRELRRNNEKKLIVALYLHKYVISNNFVCLIMSNVMINHQVRISSFQYSIRINWSSIYSHIQTWVSPHFTWKLLMLLMIDIHSKVIQVLLFNPQINCNFMSFKWLLSGFHHFIY